MPARHVAEAAEPLHRRTASVLHSRNPVTTCCWYRCAVLVVRHCLPLEQVLWQVAGAARGQRITLAGGVNGQPDPALARVCPQVWALKVLDSHGSQS